MRVAKNRVKNAEKSPCSWGAQHMYSRPSLPQKAVASTRSPPNPTRLLSEQPEQTHYCTKTQDPRLTVNRRPSESELSPLRTRKTLYASQWQHDRKARAEIVRHTTKPLPQQSQDLRALYVARLAREINYCFLPPLWLRRAGMSHSLGSLRRTVTLSSRLVDCSALAIGKTGVVFIMQGSRWSCGLSIIIIMDMHIINGISGDTPNYSDVPVMLLTPQEEDTFRAITLAC